MKKRQFLCAAAAAGILPAARSAFAADPTRNPTLLTVGGSITKGNRGAVDPVLDQLMARHGVKFQKALALDSETLHRMPHIDIRPTLEYDSKPHQLTGPLLTTVLNEAGVDLKSSIGIGLRAIDGYNVNITLAEIQTYRMIIATHVDGQPMSLGGLGPQWAVYDADSLDAFRGKPVKDRFALCPWGLYYIDVAPG